MAWPQAPQPAPAPPAAAGSSLPLGPIVTAAGGFLTFLFSFVQIVKADSEFSDTGFSVWTTDPGFFGIGTWIPLFALLAGAAALARGFVKGLDDKQVAGFGILQVQLASVAFALLLWLGYMVNILLSDFVTFGLGAFLLFLGLAAVVAGTVLSVLDQSKGTTTGISTSPGGPVSGQWQAPAGPQPPPQQQGQWPQPTPPPAPQPAPQQWQPQPPPGPAVPPPPPQQWQQPAAPGQWQPDPAGPPPPPPPQQSWTPPPGPEQAPPPPAPGGGLHDPGTQVIPGPPPAPPPDET
ncbi:MAG TPA: hypothetical protein VF228_06020 [Iamia sp.]